MKVVHYSGFDWDSGNTEKIKQHGLNRELVEEIFSREMQLFPDLKHSDEEQRYLAIGIAGDGRNVFIVFTLRKKVSALLIRPISARYMREKEAKKYGKEKNSQS